MARPNDANVLCIVPDLQNQRCSKNYCPFDTNLKAADKRRVNKFTKLEVSKWL